MDQQRPADEGIIRVFVSSTFRDMQAERDVLVRHVFPELQRRCRERGVEFSAIDLRWGITADQAARGEVLAVCLDEIDRCRPFFVGILGSRYGWIPDAVDPDLLEAHPWLAHHRGTSITELEWRHGVLNDPAAAAASFYFRRYEPTTELAMAEPEAPDAARRLGALEAAVRAAGLPARDEFGSPGELGAVVLDDLWRAMDRALPPEGAVTDLDKQRRAQQAFRDSRLRVYVDRPEYFDRLDHYVIEGGEQPLLVSGPAGSGKSALLANWVHRRHQTDPDVTFVFYSVAASPGVIDYRGLVRSLLGELKPAETVPAGQWTHGDYLSFSSVTGGTVGPAVADDELVPALADELGRAGAADLVVLVVDGLDQLLDAAAAADLLWLPRPLPDNVSVVVSAREGKVADRVERAAAGRLDVLPLTEAERERMIAEQLRVLHGKRLDAGQTGRVARAPQAANPLFLKTFLEELRVLGSFEELDATIGHYLAASNTGDLVDLILERCEHDYDPDDEGVVPAALTAIWASSRGLAEPDILNAAEVPQAYWSPVRMALQESLVSYSGTIGFSHDDIADAVASRYLPTPEERRAAHRRLARFFAAQPLDGRTAVELLYQLDAAEDWDGLSAALQDLPVFAEAWEIAKPAVIRHWEHLTAATGLTPAAAYADVTARPEDFDDQHVWAVAALFMTTGQPDAAIPLQHRLATDARRDGDPLHLQAALGQEGVSLFLSGDHAASLARHEEEEAICRRFDAWQELQMCLGNKANPLIALERFDEARRTLDEAIDLCRRLGDTQQLGRRLATLADLLHKQGDLLAAEATLRDAVPILEAGGDHIALEAGAQRLNDLGVALKNAEHYDRAEACYLGAERLARALGRPSLVGFAIMNRGVVLGRMRRIDEALAALAEAEAIAREAGDPDVLMRCLFNRAGRLVEAERYAEALPPLDEAMRLARETGQEAMLPHMEHMAAAARSHLW